MRENHLEDRRAAGDLARDLRAGSRGALESMPVGAVGLIGLTVARLSGYVEHEPNKVWRTEK
jgi:hypothetical protein